MKTKKKPFILIFLEEFKTLSVILFKVIAVIFAFSLCLTTPAILTIYYKSSFWLLLYVIVIPALFALIMAKAEWEDQH